MKPTEFHKSMTDVIDSSDKFRKLWWAMLRNPDETIAKHLDSRNAKRLLPGAFLFINLLLSEILQTTSILTPADDTGWPTIVLKESCHHVIGTLLLLLLLKLAFWQTRPLKIFSILCLSSIVFIPYTLVTQIISSLLTPNFRHFMLSLLTIISHHGGNYSELFTPALSTVFKLIFSLALLSTVIIWWFHLLSIGCSHVSKYSERERTVRLASAISAYVVIICTVFITYMVYGFCSSFSQCLQYQRMKDSFLTANYPEAYLLSLEVSKADLIPPLATYRAYLIQAVSHQKTFWPDDHSFDEAIEDIKTTNYCKAQSDMLTKIHEILDSQPDTNRIRLASMRLSLDGAANAHNSPGYSETENQPALFSFRLGDIPIAFFP